MAVYGVKLIGRSLPRAYRNGEDIAARTDMCMAALCGGLAFLKGLGIGHALTHVLGAHYYLPTAGRPFTDCWVLSEPTGKPVKTLLPIWPRC